MLLDKLALSLILTWRVHRAAAAGLATNSGFSDNTRGAFRDVNVAPMKGKTTCGQCRENAYMKRSSWEPCSYGKIGELVGFRTHRREQ